jgi:hypothetical protein
MIKRDQRGFIAVDFIFAMVLVLSFCSMLFALSFTLVVASVTQYITYSAARNYAGAHINVDDQKDRANAKYQELVKNKAFASLYKGDWFAIDAEPGVGDHTQIIEDYEDAAQSANQFWGVGTNFTAKILDFNVPFFGSSQPDSDGSGSGFKTYMASYMGREVTTDECKALIDQRWDQLKKLGGYGGAGAGKYYPMTDDGC